MAADWQSFIKPDKWKDYQRGGLNFSHTCTCNGIYTFKFETCDGCGIRLNVMPNKQKFRLYTTLRFCNGRNIPPIIEWDKPLDQLQDILNQHEL